MDGPHRDDLATDPDGLVSGVAEEVSVDGNGLSLPFVGPACVVPERTTTPQHLRSGEGLSARGSHGPLPQTLHHVGQVHGVRNRVRLPVIEGLQFLRQHEEALIGVFGELTR